MFGSITTAVLLGVSAVPVTVEARVGQGLPQLTIVGMREADARACRERIRCGLQAAGLGLPLGRITVSLAPADLPKRGAGCDLPVLLALLVAAGEVPAEQVRGWAAYAEVGLDGTLRPVPGVLAATRAAAAHGSTTVLVDAASGPVAAHVPVDVLAATSVPELMACLREGSTAGMAAGPCELAPGDAAVTELADVRGQQVAVRALTIAAAGGHNLLLHGPPGCGKTMLASRLPGLLPALPGEEYLEVCELHDAAGVAPPAPGMRPFRAPHHGVTPTALAGGGSGSVHVGEVTLAHRGVLFLDEVAEFRPSALDALRQPLESGHVAVRRAGWMAQMPARVQLVAAMNLCRCGRTGTRSAEPCRCSDASREAYRNRVSGAILSRFDLGVRLVEPHDSLAVLPAAPTSEEACCAVLGARERQDAHNPGGCCNALLRRAEGGRLELGDDAGEAMARAIQALRIGGRTQLAVLRVARTIADLAGRDRIVRSDLVEALGYRPTIEAS